MFDIEDCSKTVFNTVKQNYQTKLLNGLTTVSINLQNNSIFAKSKIRWNSDEFTNERYVSDVTEVGEPAARQSEAACNGNTDGDWDL